MSYNYRCKKELKLKSISFQIIILSILTIILMTITNSLSEEGFHQKTKLQSILQQYWYDRESYPNFWNDLQRNYKCCGVHGSSDWELSIPKSCYQTDRSWLIWKNAVTCRFAHQDGCYCAIVKYLVEMTSWFKLVGMIFVSIGVFGIFGMFLTGFLYSVFHHQNQENHQNKQQMVSQI